MSEDRRASGRPDRRAHPRGGRRDADQKKPWYMRRRLWLAAASLVFVGWRRVRDMGRRDDSTTPMQRMSGTSTRADAMRRQG